MQNGNKKLFLDKDKLYELANLRMQGWAFRSIANHFGCDKGSVRYICRKYSIEPEGDVICAEHIITKVIIDAEKEQTSYTDFDGEKINRGKSYKDYIKVAKEHNQPEAKVYQYEKYPRTRLGFYW